MHFPRVDGVPEQDPFRSPRVVPRPGSETILLVKTMLRASGYQELAASRAEEAIRIGDRRAGRSIVW